MPITSSNNSLLDCLNEYPFTSADRMLVAHLREDWNETSEWILLATALCGVAVREGHAYLDFANPKLTTFDPPANWPKPSEWQAHSRNSPVIRAENESGNTPLILCNQSALYLEKYYAHEKNLATLIKQRCQYLLARPTERAQESSPQPPHARAAEAPFFIITGGPGTGKTTLALRYLNHLLDTWNHPHTPHFASVAPTGKAAARLGESIVKGLRQLEASEQRKEELRSIPCLTIHRLLGSLPNRVSFRHNAKNPIPYDALIVDESSMVDLPLMRRLLDALPESCQVLLLGDKDQLSSVDVGSVFADLLEASQSPSSPLHDRVERLAKTYRFSETSSIFRACLYSKLGDSSNFETLLAENLPDFRFHSLKEDAARIPESAISQALEHHKTLASCDSPYSALAALGKSIILCPTRRGPFGAEQLNRLVQHRLQTQYSTTGSRPRDALSKQSARKGSHAEPIVGQPIIVLENDYELELFNGDLGIIWNDGAYFPGQESAVRRFRINELPCHESAFALTIHKSQGSEFEKVVCLFGPEKRPILSRELVYTAFSRAKQNLIIYANPLILTQAIQKTATRATRLSTLLLR